MSFKYYSLSFVKVTLGAPLLFLATISIQTSPAVTITGSASCSISDTSIGLSSAVTTALSSASTANCSLLAPQPPQHAVATVTAGSFSVSATANVAESFYSLDSKGNMIPPIGFSTAKANVTEQYQVEATGPVRPGFLVLSPDVSTTPDLDLGTTFASVAVSGITDIAPQQGTMANCSPCEFAVSLGTIYDLSLQASVDSEAGPMVPDDTISLAGCALLVGVLAKARRV